MIKKSEDMRKEIRSNVHGGNGDVSLLHFLEKEEMAGKSNFAARMSIPVGGAIKEHVHGSDVEIFIIESGTALFNDNGTLRTLGAGDAVFTGPDEMHAISNAGDTVLEFIGIIIT